MVRIKWQTERQKEGKTYASLRWTESGARKARALGFVSVKEAEEERRKEEARITLNLRSSSATASVSQVRIGDLIEQYLEEVETKKKGGEGHRTNILNRCAHLGRHLGKLSASMLAEEDLEDYAVARRVEKGGRRGNIYPKRATIESELKVLRLIFKRAYRRKIISRPCPDLPRMTWEDKRPARRLTEMEVEALIQTAQRTGRPELGRLITFCAWCPRRPIAIFALTRADCRRVIQPGLPRAERQIWIARDKGQRERGWSPLAEPALAALTEQLAATSAGAEAPAWPKPSGGAYTVQTFRNQLERLSTRAGVSPAVRPYDLRKFGAVRIMKATGSSYRTLPFTGHQSTATLERHYLYQERGEAEQAAENITWSKKDSPA